MGLTAWPGSFMVWHLTWGFAKPDGLDLLLRHGSNIIGALPKSDKLDPFEHIDVTGQRKSAVMWAHSAGITEHTPTFGCRGQTSYNL